MVKVEVNKADLNKILSAIEKIKGIVLSQALLIPEESAKEFADVLKQNIDTQKYGDFQQPRKSTWKNAYPETADLFWVWLKTAYNSLTAKKVSSTASQISWRVGFGSFLSKTSSAIATKKKAISKPVMMVVTGKKFNKTTGKWEFTKRPATLSEIKAKSEKEFTHKIRNVVDKGVVRWTPEQIAAENARRGLGDAKSVTVTRKMDMGKPHETPGADRIRAIKIKRQKMFGGTDGG